MYSGEQPPSSAAPPDPDEPDEPVLVEAHDFSEDDDNFGNEEAADEDEDFAYEDEDEQEDEHEEDEEDGGADEFESDGEEMSLARVCLHDLNTLQHFYRFGLINPHAGIPIRNSLTFAR
jgi:hypothetical protein